jgi:phytol kinase
VTPVWLGMTAVLLALGAGFAVLRAYQKRFSPPPEVPRKLMHVTMGLVTLSFPWLFTEKWPVIVLAVVAEAALIAVRSASALRSSVGTVLHEVDRDSLGELCFPVAVAIVFWLSGDHPVLYVVPILMLTLADALAALIGLRYGVVRFATTEEPKSLEGSVAFVVVAFLSALVPLQLMTDIPRANVLLIALILGLLVGMLEAVSWHGLDNLLVPVGAYTFLVSHQHSSANDLLVRLVVLAVLVAAAVAWRRRTTLSHRGAVEAALAGYVFWVLGGWPWLLAPAAMFFTYALLPPLRAEEQERPTNAEIVATNVASGVAWVLAAAITGTAGLLFPFTVAFAAHTAMNGYARWAHTGMRSRAMTIELAFVSASAVVVLPWIAISPVALAPRLVLAAVAVAACAIAAGIGALLERRRGASPVDVPRAWMQAGAAFLLSAGGWAVMTLWLKV